MGNSNKEALVSNLASLENIVHDILSRMNHQVMGNIVVLENTKLEMTPAQLRDMANMLEVEQENVRLEVFTRTAVDALVRSPVKISLGRIAGLLKVIGRLRDQIETANF
jgi:hypothetical protein